MCYDLTAMPNPQSPKPKTPSPSSPPQQAFGRSLADFGELLPKEKTLLQCCREGTVARITESQPEAETASNSIRASFLRFLALGGDESAPVHENGVFISGAWITGGLDLSHAKLDRQLVLHDCSIEYVYLAQTDLVLLSMAGSRVRAGMVGDRLRCSGGIFLRDGFHCVGEVRLLGARIAGDLDCSNATFENPGDDALSVDGSEIGGYFFLHKGTEVLGGLRIYGVLVGRDLDMGNSTFLGEECSISLDNTTVKGRFIFRGIKKVAGLLICSGLEVDSLYDDQASWASAKGKVLLDGFTYRRFGSGSSTDAATRIAWLENQPDTHLKGDFRPQPWEQLSLVLKQVGHFEASRSVSVAKHAKMREAKRYVGGSKAWDWIYGKSVGYGYRPWRLARAILTVWILCAAIYWPAANPSLFGFETHLLAPARSEPNLNCLLSQEAKDRPTACRPKRPRYEELFLPAYSAEVLIPVVSLGQKGDWKPVVSTPDGQILWWGWALRLVYWFEIVFGWFAGLLLVAAVGNLVKKD